MENLLTKDLLEITKKDFYKILSSPVVKIEGAEARTDILSDLGEEIITLENGVRIVNFTQKHDCGEVTQVISLFLNKEEVYVWQAEENGCHVHQREEEDFLSKKITKICFDKLIEARNK